jgi:hypothetical protein
MGGRIIARRSRDPASVGYRSGSMLRLGARVSGAALVAFGLLVAAGATSAAAPVATNAFTFPQCAVPDDAPHVVLFGDSLSVEAKQAFVWELECGVGAHARVLAQPGAALCDFQNAVADVAARKKVDVAVLEFVGNNRTPCTDGPTGAPLTGQALLSRYQADAVQATTTLSQAGARVVWVTPPGRVDQPDPPLRSVYEWVVNVTEPHSSLADGGFELRDRAGLYQAFMPCLPQEGGLASCWNGLIRVRMPVDDFHLCPVLETQGPCPVYSSGAARLAHMMATGAQVELPVQTSSADEHVATSTRRDRHGTRGDR